MTEKSYIALANIRGKKDYNRGDELNEGEYKNLPKELKSKFQETSIISAAMLAGDERQLKQTIQQLLLKIEALENEIKVLKGEESRGKAVTSETGGKPAPQKL